VLIDCGMFQQREELFRNWEPSPGPPETVDHMLLAHRNRPRAACASAAVKRGTSGFLTHGEAEAADSLAGHIRQQLGWDATVPEYGDVCGLE